jgi:uncharacterized membrane protein YfcA
VTPAEWAILAVTSLATSALSAVLGMAGGIVLLSVMLLFLDPLVAIPLHGVIQLVANGSRTVAQRRDVDWRIAGRYALLLFPAGLIGVRVALGLPPEAIKASIGAFALVATWRPQWLSLDARSASRKGLGRFVWLGGAVGFLNSVLGATGPLIAPFFLNLGLTRQALIGTKAACQALGHVSKTLVFGSIGFAFLEHAPLLGALSLLAIAGTWLGTRLLDRVDEERFQKLYVTVLTLIALRLLVGELWALAVRP